MQIGATLDLINGCAGSFAFVIQWLAKLKLTSCLEVENESCDNQLLSYSKLIFLLLTVEHCKNTDFGHGVDLCFVRINDIILVDENTVLLVCVYLCVGEGIYLNCLISFFYSEISSFTALGFSIALLVAEGVQVVVSSMLLYGIFKVYYKHVFCQIL